MRANFPMIDYFVGVAEKGLFGCCSANTCLKRQGWSLALDGDENADGCLQCVYCQERSCLYRVLVNWKVDIAEETNKSKWTNELNNELFTLQRATRYWLTMVWNRYDRCPRVRVMPQAWLSNKTLYAPNDTILKQVHSWHIWLTPPRLFWFCEKSIKTLKLNDVFILLNKSLHCNNVLHKEKRNA